MMRIFVISLGLLLALLNPVQARHYHHHHRSHYHHRSYSQHYSRHYSRHWGGGSNLSEPCRIARSLGGPCGCFASELIFGHTIRSLWTAASWYKFPRTEPHAGDAAVRPHHVVLVVANNGDGTVTVHDSWGTHRQSVHGWTFVDPHGTGAGFLQLFQDNHRTARVSYAKHYRGRYHHHLRHYFTEEGWDRRPTTDLWSDRL